jgi:monoamine oxidase
VSSTDETIDVAVIGAGAAGTYVAERLKTARPEWSVVVFERTDRIGGRLHSMQIPGLDHPIELGGMRFLTTHRRASDVVARFRIRTHAFDPTGGVERSYLRGRFGAGAGDPAAGAGYELPRNERGRSAIDLLLETFERIVPGATRLDEAAWADVRASGDYLDRPLADWSIGEAIGSILSPEGRRYVTDSFGYDSGIRAFNIVDAIPFLLGGGNPNAEARTPDGGMEALPLAMAGGFTEAGGAIRFGHELTAHEVIDGEQRLAFANGFAADARRVVFTGALPALRILAGSSRTLANELTSRALASVEAFPAAKLYLWYDRPWWREPVRAIRMTTDLPPRKLFYFDGEPDAPAALLAAYTDGLHTQPWRELADRSPRGGPAPSRMLAAISRDLREIHPASGEPPPPVGSAFSLWGDDPHEAGWTFWSAGARSDGVIRDIVRPVPGLDLFICGEAFSRAQSWVEGALQTAETAVEAVLTTGANAAPP